MAHNPKLEIYRIKLIEKETGAPITFRKFFAQKFNYYGRKEEKTITNDDTAKRLFADIIKHIDTKYHISEKKKKSFKAAKGGASANKDIKLSSEKFIIRGTLSGGSHGRNRFMDDVDNADSETPIDTRKVVGDKFYFLLLTPIDHYEGLVFIQGYTGASISDVFREFLQKYFSHGKIIKSNISIFVPESLKDKYLEDAVFKSIEFNSGWIIDGDHGDGHKAKKYELQVKVEIIDKSKNKTKPIDFPKIMKSISNFVLMRGDEEKKLEEFSKKPKMISDGKALPFDLANLKNIKPVLYLEQVGITVDAGLVPNFDQIDAYCLSILPEVTKEIMPSHAIEDL